ncbi:hypothetical protein KR009_004242 [Drosophila setifemur]|nr:hypothetical protein KR009_004242 [Drosophila setifemur]
MAKSGYCSNEQILKSVLKRYMNQLSFALTPVVMYMEELIHFLNEHGMEQEFTAEEVVFMARHNYEQLTKVEKERYVELAQMANVQLFAM